MKSKFVILFLVFTILDSMAILWSQVSTDDYKRADDLVKTTSDKVFYGSVRPSWIGKTSSFFYENLTPDGMEYFIVNANTLTKKSAFNQQKFAIAFESASGIKIEPGKLPIKNILFSEQFGSFAFIYDNFNWICNLKKYEIIKRDRVSERPRQSGWDWGFRDELGNGSVDSPDKKWTAFIKNFNVYIRSGDSKKEFQLSYDGGIGEYYSSYMKWSDDSKKLVSCRVIPVEKHMIYYIESSPEDQLQPRHYSYEYQKPGDAVPQKFPQLFDIESKKHIKVDNSIISDQYSVENILWNKRSSNFTFEYNKRGHQVYQVIKVDAKTGENKVIINEIWILRELVFMALQPVAKMQQEQYCFILSFTK